jgi:chromosome partitioning protein
MLRVVGSSNLRKVVVLNPKGGSGKTTLAFSLAGYLTSTGRKVALVDMDSQGSSLRWLSHRPAELPEIHGVAAPCSSPSDCANLVIQLPLDIEIAVIDAPAGVSGARLADYTVGSHAIILPVMPSDMDIHAAARLIKELLLVARLSRVNRRLGVIANRVKVRTVAYRQLMTFLERLSIALIGVIRDSQNYVAAARNGLSIHEMPRSKVGKDLRQWETVTRWLEERLATPLSERDLRRPEKNGARREPFWRRRSLLTPVAGTTIVVAVSVLFWVVARMPERNGAVAPVATAGSTSTESGAEMLSVLPNQMPVAGEFVEALVEEAAADEDGPSTAAETLRQKWRLSGVAMTGGEPVVFLTDRSGLATRRVTADRDVDGWLVTDAGQNYAVLALDGEEIRLKLDDSEETE